MMSPLVVQIVVVALFALTCGLLTVAWMRGRLGRAAIVVFVLALAAWIASFVVISSDVRDASEFATCGEDCTATHYATSIAFIVGPLLIALAGLAMLVVRGSRWRLRRTGDNHT